MRLADIQQLTRIAATYPSLERFLTELTLDPPEATSDEAGTPLLDEDYLILSTIHSAKGCEWASVTLLNAVDGCIPSDLGTGTEAEIEEERRLLHVAMTRARDELDIIVPQRFTSDTPSESPTATYMRAAPASYRLQSLATSSNRPGQRRRRAGRRPPHLPPLQST